MFTALLVALVVGLWMLVLARDNVPRARIAQLEARLAAMQTQLDAKQDATNRAAQNVQVKRNAIKTPDFRLSVDSAMAVALDTSATLKQLRVALIKTVEQAEAYQAEVLRYQEAVDTLLVAHLRERQAFTSQLDTLTALVNAQRPASHEWRFTRATAFGLGVSVGVAIVVALVVVL